MYPGDLQVHDARLAEDGAELRDGAQHETPAGHDVLDDRLAAQAILHAQHDRVGLDGGGQSRGRSPIVIHLRRQQDQRVDSAARRGPQRRAPGP